MDDYGARDIAMEKGVYSSFRQAEITWRIGNIGQKLITTTELQLPTNSVLHIADKLLDMQVHSILPDIHNPFIANERSQIYLDNIIAIPGSDAVFPIDEKYRYRPASFNQEIRKFWIDHRGKIYRASSLAAMIGRSNTLPVVNYNAILTPVVTGTFVYYRRFEILLRTMLNTIVQVTKKYNYLQIPLSRTAYRKTQFIQTFDTINYLTVRIKTDPSFFFLLHLINFLTKNATTSLFSQLDVAVLDRLNVILTAGDKAIIYNLGDLKAMRDARDDDNLYQLVLRHINTLKLAGYADMDISQLDDTLYDKLIDDVAPHETIDDPAEHQTSETTPEPEITQRPIPAAVIPPNKDEPPQTVKAPQPEELPHTAGIPQAPTPSQQPGHTETVVPMQRQDHVAIPEQTLPPYNPALMTSVIDHGAQQAIANATHLTDAQRDRAVKNAQAYKALLIDGMRIDTLLEQSAEPDVSNNHLDFLADKVVDASMLNSSAIDMDSHYIEHVMSRDIAAVAAQMATNGMLLIATEQHDDITQLARIRHYKLVYEDLTGRRHTVTFKLPIVSPDGTIMINGVVSRMIKQQVNLPICKIDPWRVSLASNYNKTIVERTTTRAHSYGAYITKYIAAVYKAKEALQINYGNLTTAMKLPYDYASIAKRYSRLSFAGHRFIFDYEHRLDTVLERGYGETDSTFSRGNREYDLGAMLGEANQLPVERFAIADLQWNLGRTQVDPDRLAGADPDVPILITRDAENRLDVLDGMHRLTKAINDGRETILGRLVPPAMMQRYYLGIDPGDGTEAARVRPNDYLRRYAELEKTYGIYCGTSSQNGYVYRMFFGYDNLIRFVGPNRGNTPVADQFTDTFTQMFFTVFESLVTPPKALSEWTELKILDKNFPVVFILGFEYGLHRVLEHIKLRYEFVPTGTRIQRKSSTIVIPFADGNLVFDRYPLQKSFVAAGLARFVTKPYTFAKFNNPDSYYALLQDSGISMNYLKGISDFFKLFIDPITRDVLLRMHEPTDVGSLLLRATEMLTTDDAIPASSMRNHRLRGYERFPTTLYNQMARNYATYSKQRGNRKVFSINPESVFLQLIQDQTLRIVDEINPMENIKDKHSATYTGIGGRTAQAFVVDDRRYPEDGVGILSECTPDNGKVAINTYITADPTIANVRGMFDLDSTKREDLEPSQILSVTTLLMPGATNDD